MDANSFPFWIMYCNLHPVYFFQYTSICHRRTQEIDVNFSGRLQAPRRPPTSRRLITRRRRRRRVSVEYCVLSRERPCSSITYHYIGIVVFTLYRKTSRRIPRPNIWPYPPMHRILSEFRSRLTPCGWTAFNFSHHNHINIIVTIQ